MNNGIYAKINIFEKTPQILNSQQLFEMISFCLYKLRGLIQNKLISILININ